MAQVKIPFDITTSIATDVKVRNATLGYPHLHTPDTKFGTPGEFKAALIVDGDQGRAIIAQAEEALAKWVAAAQPFVKSEKAAGLSFSENEDGTITIKSKLKAEKSDGQGGTLPNKVLLVDSQAKPVKDAVRVGGGTRANVKITLWPWYSPALGLGVQFRLRAVQILELKEFSGGYADDFEAVDDGYVATDGAPVDADPGGTGDF